jgi:hypothetical protein
MKKFKDLLMPAAVLMFLVFSFSANAQTVKVTGIWDFTVETNAGSGTPVFILKQEADNSISGTYKGQLGEAPVKGSLKGNEIKLEFTVNSMTVEYTGTVDGNTMKGKVKLADVAEGTFTAKKREP